MARWPLAVAVITLLTSCSGSDAEESALLLLDDEARAAGIAVEVSGEAIEGGLPVAVPSDEDAYVVRPEGRERLVMSPGEMIEVHGPRGEIARGPVDADRFVVTGSAQSAAMLAELLGGASIEPLSPSRYALRAPNVTWIAALLHGQDLGEARAASPFEHALAAGDAAWRERDDAVFASPGDVDPSAQSTPDPAPLVGAYAYADVLFVLDAAGGFLLRTREGTTRGTYAACPGGVEVTPAGGAEAFRMRLFEESLVDDVGLTLAPAQPPALGPIATQGEWE
jgi:hypothetical protein